MANAVAEGARTVQGAEVELSYHVDPEELSDFDAILVGAPTYHHDITLDMKNLFEEAASKGITMKRKRLEQHSAPMDGAAKLQNWRLKS